PDTIDEEPREDRAMSRNPTILVALSLALALTAAPTARAADQTVLGTALIVMDPSRPDQRKVIVRAKEMGSPDTIVGDPRGIGTTLTITPNGGTTSPQTYSLPNGLSALTGKPFWTSTGHVVLRGFKYKDAEGEHGPVRAVLLKKLASGTFYLKAIVGGTMQSVLPPNPGTDGCVRFEIGGGDAYSVRFADGKVTNDGAKKFKVVKTLTDG